MQINATSTAPQDLASIYGKGREWRELQPGLHLGLTMVDLHSALSLKSRTFPAICLSIVLDGFALDDGSEVQSGFCPDELWLSSTGQVQATAMTILHDRPVRVVELLVTATWLDMQAQNHGSDPALAAMRRAMEGPALIRRQKLEAPLRDRAWRMLRPEARGLAAATAQSIDALHLLQFLIGQYQPDDGAGAEPLPPRQMDRLIEIRRQIDRAPGRVSLAVIAREAGLSESTLRRSFRTAFGQSLRDYTLERRMLAGRNAILRDGMSVTQAAWLAGYDHASNFTAAFRRHFGYAPTALKPRKPDIPEA